MIEFNLEGKPVVVIGGGRVATRKVAALVQAGARVVVVSPAFTPELKSRQDIVRHTMAYAPACLQGAALVFACTDDREVNARIAADARAIGVWCNVADDNDLGDFTVPAMLRRGEFIVAVGTGGASPQLAAAVRRRLEPQFGPEYAALTAELRRARRIVKDRVTDPALRRRIFATLCTDCSLKLLAERDTDTWRRWFERLLEHRLREGGGPQSATGTPLDCETAAES